MSEFYRCCVWIRYSYFHSCSTIASRQKWFFSWVPLHHLCKRLLLYCVLHDERRIEEGRVRFEVELFGNLDRYARPHSSPLFREEDWDIFLLLETTAEETTVCLNDDITFTMRDQGQWEECAKHYIFSNDFYAWHYIRVFLHKRINIVHCQERIQEQFIEERFSLKTY